MQTELFTSSPVKLQLPAADIEYHQHFLNDSSSYFRQLNDEIEWHQDTISLYGKPVLIPRLNAWYGDVEAKYHYSGLQLDPLPWTRTLLSIKLHLEQMLGERFNSVLANLYRDGNDSVAWHSDDEYELGGQPLIASISLGATRRFSLRHRTNKTLDTVHLELEAGTLLIMRGSTQANWLHQVPKVKAAVGPRINLTFRQIVRSR